MKKILLITGGVVAVLLLICVVASLFFNKGTTNNSSSNSNESSSTAEYKEVDKSGLKTFEIQKEIFDLDGNTKMGKDSLLYYPESFTAMTGVKSTYTEDTTSEGAKDFADMIYSDSEDYIFDASTKLDDTKCGEEVSQYSKTYADTFQIEKSAIKTENKEAVVKKNPNIGGSDIEMCFFKLSFSKTQDSGKQLSMVINQGIFHDSDTGTQKYVVAAYEDGSKNADALSRAVRAFESR